MVFSQVYRVPFVHHATSAVGSSSKCVIIDVSNLCSTTASACDSAVAASPNSVVIGAGPIGLFPPA